MCDTALSVLKEFSNIQIKVGTVQLILLIFAWLSIISPAIHFVPQELNCALSKTENEYFDTVCSKQYSKQHFWNIEKKVCTAVFGVLVHLTWMIYIPCMYITHKQNNENEDPPYRWPKMQKHYIGQIIFRAIFLVVFIVVLISPTDTDFKFPAKFNCTLLDDAAAKDLITSFCICTDKYSDEKTHLSIAILSAAALFLILTVFEGMYELVDSCKPPDNSNAPDGQETGTNPKGSPDELKVGPFGEETLVSSLYDHSRLPGSCPEVQS